MILPLAVTLKRFAAPRCVFNFNFGFEAFLGIAKSSLYTATPCLESNSQNTVDRFRVALRSLLRRLLRWLGRRRRALLGREQRDQHLAFHAWHRFYLAVFGNLSQQPRHLRAAHFLVRHFASAMKNHRAHFVTFTQKPDDLILALVVVVFGGGRPKLDFFQLRAATAFALLVRFLVLLIKKFSVIRDFANGRIGRRRNLHQIQSLFARHPHGFVRLHDAQLAAFFVDHPDFTGSDSFIYASAVALLPEVAFCDISP